MGPLPQTQPRARPAFFPTPVSNQKKWPNQDYHLFDIVPFKWLQNMGASLRIIDQRVSLRAMNELEMLDTGLTKDRLGFWRHDDGCSKKRKV